MSDFDHIEKSVHHIDKSYLFDKEEYIVTRASTGEVVDVDIFLERVNVGSWERAYAQTLSDYININGKGVQRVLGYFLAKKDSKNLILGTHRSIAGELGVSPKTVTKTISALVAKKFLSRIRNGTYMLSPNILRYGSKTQGAMLLRIWDEVNEHEDF